MHKKKVTFEYEKKKNQPNYRDQALFCSLSPVELMNVKHCNLPALITTKALEEDRRGEVGN